MVANQILLRTIEGIKEQSGIDLAVFDDSGNVLAATYSDTDEQSRKVVEFAGTEDEEAESASALYRKLVVDGETVCIINVNGTDSKAKMIEGIAILVVKELFIAYKEQLDRESFIKNLLLDNLLLVDIYNRAKKLHLEVVSPRVVMIAETGRHTDTDALERLKGIFSGRAADFVTAVDEHSVVIVRELEKDDTEGQIDATAHMILDAFPEKEKGQIRVAIGTIVNEIKEVSRSYKEATMALDVGKIFFPEHDIIAYSVLGIGRLIYQLPIQLCRMFIGEIFEKKSPEDFDEETLITINKFFENNLNVSETSRQLYIHRNTLVYRLDKIQKTTGLDLRVFEDAITFKIAMMVVDYMKYMEDGKF